MSLHMYRLRGLAAGKNSKERYWTNEPNWPYRVQKGNSLL